MLLAFVITWFFRVPPLRTRSALEERTAAAAAAGAGASEDSPEQPEPLREDIDSGDNGPDDAAERRGQ